MSWQPRNSIVVPIDFSESAADAIRTANELADDPSHVHLVHVLVPLDAVSPGVAFGQTSDETREKHVRTYAKEFFATAGIEETPFDVRFGHPGDEIIEYADSKQADLIVIPSHGFHGLKRFVLGSVAEQVIRHANCAVLVLRRRDAD
ncbi:MAG: universal stress protein [Planctomycetota bacterium]|nr:MAG: universal stress protein [Planctomycetota bacterium]REJ87473.1 MAG: universal stress protein [Planctomycetota bacterium]REK24441.1 MAG: universal stress protein [Planctomycetota bacterium]REK38630.1 MAG: universal stress protein [Planctomycetota bacterium]